MSEFLFLFRGSASQGRSPAELQKSMQKWVTWFCREWAVHGTFAPVRE